LPVLGKFTSQSLREGEGAWSRVNQSGGDMGPGDGPDSICGPGGEELVLGEHTGTSFGTPWKTVGMPTSSW